MANVSSIELSPMAPRRVGVAADHGGYELKQHLTLCMRKIGYEVVDFGDGALSVDDDYPDFVVPLARAVAGAKIDRGVALCGSGVGACVAANKVAGVRACLIHEIFSAHQGVEDDDLNVICLGGLVVGPALAWELVQAFLSARFSGAERHRRRLAKVSSIEGIMKIALCEAAKTGARRTAVGGASRRVLRAYWLSLM